MGLAFFGLLIISSIIYKIVERCKDVGTWYKAFQSDDPTYVDNKGELRNSSNGHKVKIGEGGKQYDAITYQLLYNPNADKERKERDKASRLQCSKIRVFHNKAEEIINEINYCHKVVYRNGNHVDSTLYGKLNCNLGYQFWVNLTTGFMEETELSKQIDHVNIKKYHKKPLDNRKRKVENYVIDYSRPYTQGELIQENENILQHLANHNRNIVINPDMPKRQKFAPIWCYSPTATALDIANGRFNDGYILDYEWRKEMEVVNKPTLMEGYYD